MRIPADDLKDIVEALRRELGSVASWQLNTYLDNHRDIIVEDDDGQMFRFEIKQDGGVWILQELK